MNEYDGIDEVDDDYDEVDRGYHHFFDFHNRITDFHNRNSREVGSLTHGRSNAHFKFILAVGSRQHPAFQLDTQRFMSMILARDPLWMRTREMHHIPYDVLRKTQYTLVVMGEYLVKYVIQSYRLFAITIDDPEIDPAAVRLMKHVQVLILVQAFSLCGMNVALRIGSRYDEITSDTNVVIFDEATSYLTTPRRNLFRVGIVNYGLLEFIKKVERLESPRMVNENEEAKLDEEIVQLIKRMRMNA